LVVQFYAYQLPIVQFCFSLDIPVKNGWWKNCIIFAGVYKTWFFFFKCAKGQTYEMSRNFISILVLFIIKKFFLADLIKNQTCNIADYLMYLYFLKVQV
jgi:hypothetical protein